MLSLEEEAYAQLDTESSCGSIGAHPSLVPRHNSAGVNISKLYLTCVLH